ncbi:hypothetical protein B0T16DRAFT_81443 [Cercophora newfieldiana]|uniref:Uncharacterized protein n=1 Tax=Cercophora newfieldiana TaxID=92897 RepID=A0AA40CUW1_9PEZI|nr:hypothetical protein B0T16DRAFT_81443 [Cercophora newfieldiana]
MGLQSQLHDNLGVAKGPPYWVGGIWIRCMSITWACVRSSTSAYQKRPGEPAEGEDSCVVDVSGSCRSLGLWRTQSSSKGGQGNEGAWDHSRVKRAFRLPNPPPQSHLTRSKTDRLHSIVEIRGPIRSTLESWVFPRRDNVPSLHFASVALRFGLSGSRCTVGIMWRLSPLGSVADIICQMKAHYPPSCLESHTDVPPACSCLSDRQAVGV